MGPEEANQAFEQGHAAMMNMAKLIADYFKELMKNGFSRKEAMDLVIEYQMIILKGQNA